MKPTLAGSSIGVVVAYGIDDAIEKAVNIIKEVICFWFSVAVNIWYEEHVFPSLTWVYLWQGIDDKVLVEVFLEGGIEFTAIVIDVGMDNDVKPIVLLPTEVSQRPCFS